MRQLTLDGKFLAVFASLQEAAASLEPKIPYARISLVCSGKRNSNAGFRWEYVDDTRKPPPLDGRELDSCPGYLITKTGEVYSNKTNVYLIQNHQYGYRRIKIYDGHKSSQDFYVHTLVAMAFLDPVPGKDYVVHKD